MSIDGAEREIWVVCETRDGEILDCCFELLGKALSLATQNGSKVFAVFFGEAPKAAALFVSGTVKIYLPGGLEHADDGLLAEAVAALASRHQPETNLMAATVRGR